MRAQRSSERADKAIEAREKDKADLEAYDSDDDENEFVKISLQDYQKLKRVKLSEKANSNLFSEEVKQEVQNQQQNEPVFLGRSAAMNQLQSEFQ